MPERVRDPAEHENERPAEQEHDAPPPSKGLDAAAVLRLQRQYGNQAVSGMLARNGPTATAASPQQLFDDAVKDEKWDSAVGMLDGPLKKEIDKALTFATADQLRYLDDAAKRSGFKTASSVRSGLRAALRKHHGVAKKHAATGRGFGKIKVRYGSYKHGDAATGSNYRFPMKVTFKPDPAAVAADEIAFIQRVRLVHTATGANADPRHSFQMRATGDASTIDRLPNREVAWYGYDNSADDKGTPSGTVNPWKPSSPRDPAWMTDEPQWDEPDTTWEFETAAVCKTPAADTATRKGDPAGFVYATVTWGFTVDDKLKIKTMDIVEFNKPSEAMHEAVDEWNEQAGLPDEGDRNDPNQQTMPELI